MRLLQGFWRLFKKRSKEPPLKAIAREPRIPLADAQEEVIADKTLPSINIMVGVDYGTSNTKVAFREMLLRAPTIPIVFNHNLKAYPKFCLPSLACFNDSGELLLADEAADYLENKHWNSGFRYLKMLVAGKMDSTFNNQEAIHSFEREMARAPVKYKDITAEQLVAVYLAYIMKQVTEEILSYDKYLEKNVNLVFNIGMPIDYYENSPVRDSFEKVVAWAELIKKEWMSSRNSFDPLSYARTCEGKADYGKLDAKGPARKDTEAKVFAIPETIAEVASYTTSQGVEEGLHAIIDLGAGTTDVSIFRLLRLQELKQYWLAAKNIPKCGNEIDRLIADMILTYENNEQICSLARLYKVLDTICAKAKSCSIENDDEIKCYNKIASSLKDIFNSKEYMATWGCAYNSFRGTQRWANVKIFIAGGVSVIPCARDIFSRPWWDYLREETEKYYITFLPEPEDFNNCSNTVPFHRMEVASGLTIPLEQMPIVILPEDIEDQTPLPPTISTSPFDYDNSPG